MNIMMSNHGLFGFELHWSFYLISFHMRVQNAHKKISSKLEYTIAVASTPPCEITMLSNRQYPMRHIITILLKSLDGGIQIIQFKLKKFLIIYL